MSLPPDYPERVYAGVLGKIIGVYLGRPFEGWSYERITADLGEVWYYVHERLGKPLIVTDDDIAGTFTFLRALEDYGYPRDLTPAQTGQTWLNYLIDRRTVLWWGGLGRRRGRGDGGGDRDRVWRGGRDPHLCLVVDSPDSPRPAKSGRGRASDQASELSAGGGHPGRNAPGVSPHAAGGLLAGTDLPGSNRPATAKCGSIRISATGFARKAWMVSSK
ncbi:MAG: ADP-ribosylglycohydrolase family protein [Anaerolineae bacterium]|nr:ADP-ribosylglycohydrolase family protein [Anaerolineae bacterium]